MSQQDAIVPHHILDDSEDGSDHDQRTGAVQVVQMQLPWHGHGERSGGRHLAHADVEDARHDDKEAKDDDLDAETSHDDVLAELDVAARLGLGQETASAGLGEEGEDVAGYKELGHPAELDEGVRVAVGERDDACEDHVDGGCEEGGCEEEEE